MVFYYIKLQKLPMIRSTKFNYLLDFQVDIVKPLIKHFKCSLTLIAFKGTYNIIISRLPFRSYEFRS